MSPLFRKRPVVIEAIQFDGSRESVHDVGLFIGREIAPYARPDHKWGFSVPTLEGPLNASPGDWIIRGVKGEYYPCKPDIFTATYEPAGAISGEAE